MEIKEKTRTLVIRLVLLAVYLASGAAIFSVIEGGKSDTQVYRDRTEDLKKNMSARFNASLDLINLYTDEFYQLFQSTHHCKFSHNDWSYYQSLYFVASVTTTIGYGHLAPRKQGGRLFLLFFALLGIPLNLLTLQSVGEHVYMGLLFLIQYVERVVFKKNAQSHMHMKSFLMSIILFILLLPLGGIMYYYSEQYNGWTFLDSVYYCFVALTTIGFGDLVPNEGREPDTPYEKGMWMVRLLYLGLGLSLLSGIFASVVNASREIQSLFPCKRETYGINEISRRPSTLKLTRPKSRFKELLKISRSSSTFSDQTIETSITTPIENSSEAAADGFFRCQLSPPVTYCNATLDGRQERVTTEVESGKPNEHNAERKRRNGKPKQTESTAHVSRPVTLGTIIE